MAHVGRKLLLARGSYFKMSQYDRICLDLPATLKYLHVLGACLASVLEQIEGLSEPQTVIHSLQLAVQEVSTNSVRHAYAGQPEGRIIVTITVAQNPRRLLVDLCDDGSFSFDPSRIPKPERLGEQEGGYGLFLVRQMIDEVTYYAREGQTWHSKAGGPWQLQIERKSDLHPGGNHWRLVKNL